MPRRITPASNLLIHQFGEEGVILNLNDEKYYRLNGMAIRMWQALVSAESVEGAHTQLMEEYDVDAATLQKDLDDLIRYLHDAKMIETHD